ncbi:hypothetical protein ONA70_16360 [Micromonospora yasonensis]|uniref:hypothetical protein n=1 Tax=Micromonospora yasonensis TaxID=1128667 RepID=UPI00222FD2C3|nr:hypothetical protein [Micromonospora yasonensis]MCW3841674.1 hypothetical protein [Micromonospora yasonensis]
MSNRVALNSSDHQARAIKHESVADALFARQEEWSTVCYFYASLHRVQAALVDDPIFQDPLRLQQKSRLLKPADRFCDSHTGFFRPGGIKSWGLNELVRLLYRDISVPYEALYINSIHVRYENGPALSLERLKAHATDIKIAFQQRRLIAK